MKPSSSSSPSSATPEPNFRSSSRKQKPRCLIHILRHLLCSKSIPTYPSEGAIIDKEAADPNEKIVEEVVPTAPILMSGTVARLMGLEPLPEKPDSASLGVSGIDQYQKHGRRMPIACFELENEEFLLLTFHRRRGNSKRKELKQRRTEEFEKREERTPLLPRCKKEKEKRSSRKGVVHSEDKDLKCMPDTSCQIAAADSFVRISMQEKPINSNEVSETKKMSSRCSVEAENNKENSSPVSVLECSEFYAKPEADTSVEQSWLGGAKARRKLATETSCTEEGSTQATEGKALKHGEKGREYDNSLNVWADICRYAAEAATNSRWVHKTSLESEDFQETGAKIGSQILDELLDELTDQT